MNIPAWEGVVWAVLGNSLDRVQFRTLMFDCTEPSTFCCCRLPASVFFVKWSLDSFPSNPIQYYVYFRPELYTWEGRNRIHSHSHPSQDSIILFSLAFAGNKFYSIWQYLSFICSWTYIKCHCRDIINTSVVLITCSRKRIWRQKFYLKWLSRGQCPPLPHPT